LFGLHSVLLSLGDIWMRFFNPNKQRRHIFHRLFILIFILVTTISIVGVAQAAGTVSGLVFRDYNANGVQDTDEPGVGGVTITAYGTGGSLPVSTTSSTAQANLGTYTLTWTFPDTRVRLEFSGLPGAAQQGAASSAAGGSGTSVQFVDAGATNVNYGINRPSDYCLATTNLKLVTTCFEIGPQTTGTAQVVVSHDYAGTLGSEARVAFDNQVGTTWGVAYKRPPAGSPTGSGTIYVSAFAKRQAGYLTNTTAAIGAIYAINGTTLASSLLTTIPNAGTTLHNATDYAVDSTFYAAPGKEALGDMDISEDGTTLYVVNLNDRQLYSVDIASGTPTARGVIGNPTCVNGVYRPFGLGVRDGLVYVGGVCTGETAALGDTSGLQAYVFSFNPVTNVSAQVLTFPLNYPRGCADIFNGYVAGGNPVICRTGVQGSSADWQPWRDTWPTPDLIPPGTGFSGGGGDEFYAYAQPILAGIEFVGEDMVVSFRDRMGDQIGFRDNGPDGLINAGPNPFPDTLVTVTAGDILRAGPNGAGGWTIEAGAAGTDFPASVGANPPYSEQGPGNGEFYWQDDFAGAHDETITGGIVQVPGAPEISAEVMDPGALFSAGTAWLDNGTGNRNREFTIIPATAPFGKGNGLGDLAALCDSAPIEIGNYVWFDANQNGIQDANEQPIAGVVVTLTDALGNPILVGGNPVTATTDAQGRYLFSSNAAGTTTASSIYGVPFAENTNYQVRINTTQAALAGYNLTTPNAGGATNDVRDSNGVAVGTLAVANVTTGTAGQNNHTIDFGFFTQPYSLGNRVWFDDGRGGGVANDGIQNGTEPGIDGVTVNLLDSNGNIIATTVTSGGGYYRFDNLAPGSYTVEIPSSNFVAGSVLNGLNSSADAATSGTPNNDVDRDDNGVIPIVGGGVRSNPIQLGPPGPSEPTTTTDLGPGDSTLLPTGRSNLTIDFGFFGVSTNYSLGNRVWLDSNNNGVIDAGERGIGNVVLNLYTVTGGVTSATPLRTTTTDTNGYYLFDNLPAGDYVVEVASANCATGGPLSGLTNSTGAGQESDPNLDGDNNDNGLDSTGSCSVRSGIVTLGSGASEPTGESDIGPQGSGIASDDHSNLTVDFGYFGTPTGGTGSGPGPVKLDPAITKQVDPAFAQPGDEVRWTITLQNPHNVDIHNISFVDNFPSQLEIISTSVDNNAGALVVSGNSVSFSIVVINPGQSVHVHVLTRIRIGTPVPFIITNTVNLTNGLTGSATQILASASATVTSAGSLPATGFPPIWRDPLMVGMGVLFVLFGIRAVRGY
jgi:uncharacterized repeat protein (TIGR01451 family)